MSVPSPPRFLPDVPLPPYTFVPGRAPHPVSDPAGHQFCVAPEVSAPLDPTHWERSPAYLLGMDLFNHGYYWEAHETWERLWHAAGRRGTTADFLKGLIKLAAAGVKVREGQPRGIRTHAERAAALFQQTAATLGADEPRYLGLRLGDLLDDAQRVERLADEVQPDPDAGVRVVFDFVLIPTRENAA